MKGNNLRILLYFGYILELVVEILFVSKSYLSSWQMWKFAPHKMVKEYPKAKKTVLKMGRFVLHKPFPWKFGHFFYNMEFVTNFLYSFWGSNFVKNHHQTDLNCFWHWGNINNYHSQIKAYLHSLPFYYKATSNDK